MKNERIELNDMAMEKVIGGYVASDPSKQCGAETAVSHNMPKINPDEKYIMSSAPTADDIISELKS